MIINTTSLPQARKQIQKLKKDNKNQQIIIQAQDDVFNRKILENKDVDVLISPESHDRKDKLKQRDSGLNEIHCKLAKENNIKIAIDINQLKKLNPKDKAIILSRIIQNIKLCKRTKTQIIVIPKQSKQDILSFFITLKGSTQQTKLAF